MKGSIELMVGCNNQPIIFQLLKLRNLYIIGTVIYNYMFFKHLYFSIYSFVISYFVVHKHPNPYYDFT